MWQNSGMTAAELHMKLTQDEPATFQNRPSPTLNEIRAVLPRALAQATANANMIEAEPSAEYLALRLQIISTIFFPYSSLRDVAITPSPVALDFMIPGSITVVLETILGCVASDPSIDVPMTCIDLDKWFTATHEDFRQRDGHSTEYNTLENLHTYYGAVIRRDHVTAAIRHLSGEIESIRKSAEDARIFAEDARLAAGQAGENSLISFFDKHSSEAGWKATGLACASVLALGLAMLVGWLVIRSAHELSTGMILGRLSLTLPLFAVAAYLGKLGGHFRDSARWARTAKVQLQSISAFAATIDDATSRDDVRKILGRRVFSSPDFGSTSSADSDAVGLLQAAADITGKLKP